MNKGYEASKDEHDRTNMTILIDELAQRCADVELFCPKNESLAIVITQLT